MKGFCRSISIMPPRESLTRKQKGKAPVSKSSPNVDLDEIHRDAPVNTLNLYFSQHLLVVDAIEQFRAEDGRQDASNDLLILICYESRVNTSVESRGPGLGEVGGVQKLLRECRGVGVMFIIPRDDQRPWSPPVGYHCVYEAYIQDDTKLWFPIPRLIKSYAFRRDVAISQFLNGSFRIAVTLIVMAAEIDISLNVRAFEELTFVKPMKEGLYSVKMLPN